MSSAGLRLLVRTFASLESPNFRYYLLSTVISISGMWMQIVGLIWLMLKLTGSPAAAGLAQALLYGPLLLGGLWAGTLADRLDKRLLMLWTQVGQAIAAGALAVLAFAGCLNLPAVLVVAFLLGCVRPSTPRPGRACLATLPRGGCCRTPWRCTAWRPQCRERSDPGSPASPSPSAVSSSASA
jgi:hypothetical protein